MSSEENSYPSDKADKVLVRMPDGMRDRIKAAAKEHNRTMNAEIIDRLDRSFATADMGLKGDPLDHVGHLSLMLSMLLNEKFQGKTREEIAAMAKEATRNINSKLALVRGPNQVVLDKDKLARSTGKE
jgi:hypothetical protein